MSLVEVALPLPVRGLFTYRVDDPAPPRGARVVVPFGRRRVVGFVVRAAESAPRGIDVRPVEDVLDPDAVLSDSEWRLAEWMADYYVAPLGTVLKLFYPPGATRVAADGRGGSAAPERLHVLPAGGPEDEDAVLRSLARSPAQRRAWLAARDLERPVERAAFLHGVGVSASTLRALAGRGLVSIEPRPVRTDPYAGRIDLPDDEGALTEAQTTAVDTVRRALVSAGSESPRPILLQGVTGSGKTRVYVEIVDEALARGGRAIVLVPEIGLAAPVVARFQARFGEKVAVLHSGLSDGERRVAWERVRHREAPVLIGARSALFAPVGRAAVIIVDEEHESAYKQDETPRYLARDVAVYRGRLERSVVVLGSATPSIESRAHGGSDKYERVVLPDRIGGRPLPSVEIVDLARGEPGEAGEWVAPGLTRRLAKLLDETVAAGDQALLFLNRRGFSSFVQCLDCGWVARCPECLISLTVHRRPASLLCHYCAHHADLPPTCPECHGAGLDTRGFGTQQVEGAVRRRYPDARIARMDLDTTTAKWSHARIYRSMQAREIDILVGTQMIAKGFDLPGVSLVGVVSADTALHLPDFRAAERTFQLLAQVAGRAGRGEKPGRVAFQTFLPDHPAIVAAAGHDYEAFYRQEVALRRELAYPPATRIANIVVSGRAERKVATGAERVAARLRSRPAAGLAVVGPAPAPLERLRGRYRHHALVKSVSPSELARALRDLDRNEADLVGRSARIEIDRDPLSLL